MAGGAFNLMIRHMFSMERLGAESRGENLRFIMAFKTLSFRHMGIPLNHTEMTFLAGDPSIDILAMIEIPSFDIDIAFGRNVAGGATSNGARDAVFFSLCPRLIVMADETVDFMNPEVGSLNDLGVAGGAAEFHPPSEFLEVFSMGEGDVLIDHVSLEILSLMTSLLEAGRITDLRVGLRGFLSGDEVGQGDLSIHPLSFHVVEKPRLIMALGASDTPVTGGLPGIDIGIHLMAEATKGRGF